MTALRHRCLHLLHHPASWVCVSVTLAGLGITGSVGGSPLGMYTGSRVAFGGGPGLLLVPAVPLAGAAGDEVVAAAPSDPTRAGTPAAVRPMDPSVVVKETVTPVAPVPSEHRSTAGTQAASVTATTASPPTPVTASPPTPVTAEAAPAPPVTAPPPTVAPVSARQPGPLSPRGVGGSWALRFDDEFNAGALDGSKWSTGWLASGVTPPVNSYEQECYDPNEVSESGGALHLAVISSPCAVGGRTYPYRSGMVNTDGKAQFTYGFFEARIYLPGTAAGIVNWPAWWTDGQNWPADGEMDIMEGLEGQACWHFHSNAGGPGSCASGNFSGWHTYGADWEPGSVTYYYDGVAVGRITTGITSSPMYLILNDAVNQPGQGQAAPSIMEVDYVRVWSKG